MKLTLKQKLIGSSLIALILMATSLTWLAANRLSEQTQQGIHSRVESLTKAATSGIRDWIQIRKSIASAFNHFATAPDVVPYLQQARYAGGFDDIYFGTPEGKMYRSHPERNRVDYDPRTRPWYQSAESENKQLITPAYRDALLMPYSLLLQNLFIIMAKCWVLSVQMC